ncbi:class I SAM-dependent methyltransferase [Candidatus Woesearchaeota archaeon]|nr:class I SAM-dependent methyltransferase [Candidatus Woesearchaeota archaeon]
MKTLLKGYFKYLYSSVTRRYMKALFLLLEKNPEAVLVDAGCWSGGNTADYGKAVGTTRLIGLELVRSAAKKAMEKGISVLIADLNRKIPMKPATADVVVANHVIEHLYNVDGFAGELYRILKPNGYVLVGTPNLASWHNLFALLIGKQPYSGPTVKLQSADGGMVSEMKSEKKECLLSEVENKAEGEHALGHIVVMTYKTLVSLLKSKGFIIEESRCFGYHPFPPFIANVLARLDKSHSHYVLVKARKPG